MRLAADDVPEVRYSATRGLEFWLRRTDYRRADVAEAERRLHGDRAFDAFWMHPPPRYAAYF